MNWTILSLLFLGGAILTAGDLLLKEWVVRSNNLYYWAGLALWILGLLLLAESFRYEHIGIASLVFVLVNVSTLSLVSWLWYGEELSGLQSLGVLLGLAAVGLLEWGR